MRDAVERRTPFVPSGAPRPSARRARARSRRDRRRTRRRGGGVGVQARDPGSAVASWAHGRPRCRRSRPGRGPDRRRPGPGLCLDRRVLPRMARLAAGASKGAIGPQRCRDLAALTRIRHKRDGGQVPGRIRAGGARNRPFTGRSTAAGTITCRGGKRGPVVASGARSHASAPVCREPVCLDARVPRRSCSSAPRVPEPVFLGARASDARPVRGRGLSRPRGTGDVRWMHLPDEVAAHRAWAWSFRASDTRDQHGPG